jgi:hypothetical protein
MIAVKIFLLIVGIIGLVLIIIAVTTPREPSLPDDTLPDYTLPDDTLPDDTKPSEKITLDNTIKLLKNNNVKLLGSNKCAYTQAQLRVFSNKLQSSRIYMNCDNNACNPELISAGLANGKTFNWPIWLLRGKVIDISSHSSSPAENALSIEAVYNLVQNNL